MAHKTCMAVSPFGVHRSQVNGLISEYTGQGLVSVWYFFLISTFVWCAALSMYKCSLLATWGYSWEMPSVDLCIWTKIELTCISGVFSCGPSLRCWGIGASCPVAIIVLPSGACYSSQRPKPACLESIESPGSFCWVWRHRDVDRYCGTQNPHSQLLAHVCSVLISVLHTVCFCVLCECT